MTTETIKTALQALLNALDNGDSDQIRKAITAARIACQPPEDLPPELVEEANRIISSHDFNREVGLELNDHGTWHRNGRVWSVSITLSNGTEASSHEFRLELTPEGKFQNPTTI